MSAEQLTEGASALLELAKKSNATSPVEAQPQQPQKTVYLVRCGAGGPAGVGGGYGVAVLRTPCRKPCWAAVLLAHGMTPSE